MVKCDCPNCGGRGKYSDIQSYEEWGPVIKVVICPRCKGTGKGEIDG